MILSFLFFTFVAYLIFRLVFDFLLPVYRTTRQVRQKFREMNRQTHKQEGSPAPSGTQKKSSTEANKSPVGEYIDFEEVKDR